MDIPELRFLSSVSAGSAWPSSCCVVEMRPGKPAQHVDTLAITIAKSKGLSSICDPGISLSFTIIHITMTV